MNEYHVAYLGSGNAIFVTMLTLTTPFYVQLSANL